MVGAEGVGAEGVDLASLSARTMRVGQRAGTRRGGGRLSGVGETNAAAAVEQWRGMTKTVDEDVRADMGRWPRPNDTSRSHGPMMDIEQFNPRAEWRRNGTVRQRAHSAR